MKKPVILVTTGRGEEEHHGKRIFLYKSYADCILQAGGIPVIAAGGGAEELLELVKRCDGLVLTGGDDFPPALYGQEEQQEGRTYDAWRDTMEIELLKQFMKQKKPVLGICRGFQLINVVCGGTLHQDIERKLHVKHPYGSLHEVCVNPGTWWEKVYGKEFIVNSFHHQALDRLGDGIIVTVRDEKSGVAEAFAHETLPVVGVQWHPERMIGEVPDTPGGADMLLFVRKFVEGCMEK